MDNGYFPTKSGYFGRDKTESLGPLYLSTVLSRTPREARHSCAQLQNQGTS